MLLELNEPVKLKIYNSLGQLVATLADESMKEGLHNYLWNAKNLPCGIYSCKIQFDNQFSTIKMILINY